MRVRVSENSNAGVGIGGVLQVVFIVLKLCGLIDWSWLWVLSPLWIPLCLYIVTAGLVVLIRSILGGYYN